MKEFVNKLEKETKARLRIVEIKEVDMLKKSLEASNILGEAFDCLKKFIENFKTTSFGGGYV